MYRLILFGAGAVLGFWLCLLRMKLPAGAFSSTLYRFWVWAKTVRVTHSVTVKRLFVAFVCVAVLVLSFAAVPCQNSELAEVLKTAVANPTTFFVLVAVSLLCGGAVGYVLFSLAKPCQNGHATQLFLAGPKEVTKK